MLISDWSSDVCSSDLIDPLHFTRNASWRESINVIWTSWASTRRGETANSTGTTWPSMKAAMDTDCSDRKNAGEGRRVEGRVALGGRRSIQKKNLKKQM